MQFLRLVTSAIRSYLWPGAKQKAPAAAEVNNGVLFSATLCSGLCIALSIAAVVLTQIAFSRVGRNNLFGLSQDTFYTLSGWAFLGYDLIHIYVVAVFAYWLVRSLCWEAWIGGSASIVSSCADGCSLSVSMFLQMPALNALANERPAALPHPEAGYDLICSTLDFAQGSFALAGSFFLAAAAFKAGKPARMAAWFILLGFFTSAFQIAEVGLHTGWTEFLDDWVTPGTEVLEHAGITACLWALFSANRPNARLSRKPSHPGILRGIVR